MLVEYTDTSSVSQRLTKVLGKATKYKATTMTSIAMSRLAFTETHDTDEW